MVLSPWLSSASRSSGRSRLASSPACTPGCRVLTRPSRISGKPVSALTGCTSTEASSRACRVPPVEYSSKPRRISPGAKAGRLALLLTERRALLGKEFYRLGEDPVLFALDPGMQRLGAVAGFDGNRRLEKDRARVDLVGDQVDRAAGDLDAVRQRLLDGVHGPAESRQQRGVDVQYPAREGAHELGAQDAVVAGVHDQLHSPGPQPIAHGSVPLREGTESPLRELPHCDAMPPRKPGGSAGGPVGGHRHYFVAALDQVPEVAALAAGKHAQANLGGHLSGG